MIVQAQNYLEEAVTWQQDPDPHYPYRAEANGDRLVLRLNDFPDENLYTLLVNDEEVASFDDWPKQWERE